MNPSEFALVMLGAAQGALLWIAGGVAAGAVVFAVIFGIRKGTGAVRAVAGGEKDAFGLEEYVDEY